MLKENYKKMARDGKQTTLESWMLVNGKRGDVFYTDKEDRIISASAHYYKRDVSTERVVVVSINAVDPTAKRITKVTIL